MRVGRSSQALTIVLIAGLIALLVVLATLQYRWLGQISIAERQTMQTYLRNQTRALQEEISSEIESAASKLTISLEEFHADSWNELVDRYQSWKATSKFGGLINNFYVARLDANHQFTLSMANQSAKRLDNIEWPPELSEIRKRFEPVQRGWANETPRQEEQHKERLGSMIEHGYVAEEIPAIVRFAIDFRQMKEAGNREDLEKLRGDVGEALRRSAITILVLDSEYLRQNFIPALFKRRFSTDGSLDYDVSVIYDRPSERTARNERELTVPASGDASANIFIAGANSGEQRRGPRWQFVIRHRAGSLDAAVESGRQKNILASFGILSLLALSVVFVIVISRRAQRLARKQMDFIAGVSHEFRTPLAVIHAISENLADGLISDKRQIEECGVVIRNDSRRLAGMVEQVLEFAGASRGKNLYQPQAVDVKQLIEQALAANPTIESQRDWEIEKKIDIEVPAALADPVALASAVRNIVDNAVKYSPDRHWLRVSANASANGQQPMIEITVSDRGIGIPDAELPHIFEPFYRGRDVVAAQVHGNGLGLSLVKNIIEAHGGTISVDSIQGRGSTFRLTVPAASGNHDPVH